MRAARFLFGCILSATLMLILIATNVMQLLVQVLRLVSASHARRATESCAFFYWALTALIARHLFKVKFVFSGDAFVPGENAIVFCNHQSMTDQVVFFELGLRGKMLGQQRGIAKDSIKWIPGIGWGAWLHGSVLVKRDWLRDQETVRSAFRRFVEEKIPLWLTLYPEGTRITPAKLAASQDFARRKGLYVPQRGLIPRSKGFAAAVAGLREHVSRVYDISIYYPGGIPPLFLWACGAVKEIHVRVRAFPIGTLPQGDEALGEWLQQCFVSKDHWLLEQEALYP